MSKIKEEPKWKIVRIDGKLVRMDKKKYLSLMEVEKTLSDFNG